MNLHHISLPGVLFLMVLIPRSLRLAVRCQTRMFIVRVCVCVCACVCVCLFFHIILYVNCFGRTVLYMCIEYHI